MSAPLRPPSPMVVVAWLRSLPELSAGVATTLPADASTWAESGFVVIQAVGGAGSRYVPQRHPVVTVDCWAASLDSGHAPLGRASQVAEVVRAACYRDGALPAVVTPAPGDYGPALVQSAYPIQDEPRRIPDPDGSRAHFQFDMAVMWVAA